MPSSTSTSSDFISVLDQAALAFRSREVSRPAAEDVVNALLQTERAAKQRPLDYSLMQLQGQWQLCFATGTRKIRQGGIRLKQGYYVPKIASAHISFDTDESGAATIGNQAQLGFLQLNLTGPARYQRKKNLLMFEFTQLQLQLGKTSLYRGTIRGGDAKEKAFAQTPIAKLPFFAFFLITENFIAARGRGGGLALWVKS